MPATDRVPSAWANTFGYYTTEKSDEIESEYDESGEPWVGCFWHSRAVSMPLTATPTLKTGDSNMLSSDAKPRRTLQHYNEQKRHLILSWAC